MSKWDHSAIHQWLTCSFFAKLAFLLLHGCVIFLLCFIFFDIFTFQGVHYSLQHWLYCFLCSNWYDTLFTMKLSDIFHQSNSISQWLLLNLLKITVVFLDYTIFSIGLTILFTLLIIPLIFYSISTIGMEKLKYYIQMSYKIRGKEYISF